MEDNCDVECIDNGSGVESLRRVEDRKKMEERGGSGLDQVDMPLSHSPTDTDKTSCSS